MSEKIILEGSKLAWHQDRINQWKQGKPIVPITIDMALTRACNFKCEYCYGQLQENKRFKITMRVMTDFIDDCSQMGVKAISLVSDGESICNPIYPDVIEYAHSKGIDIALGTNGSLLTEEILKRILPKLTYLRFNISAADKERYMMIHGVSEKVFHDVIKNIENAVALKKQNNWDVTIGLQMVLLPSYEDQIIPLARFGQKVKPDYLVIKHCSDDETGSLGVDYSKYEQMYKTLKEAETYSVDDYLVKVKWEKISSGNSRSYSRCYGPAFHLQISGSGLVAPCGMLFNERYKDYHIGNFVNERFRDIVNSDRYQEIMRKLASDEFDAKTMCGSLCLQHMTNIELDNYKKGCNSLSEPDGPKPIHVNFI